MTATRSKALGVDDVAIDFATPPRLRFIPGLDGLRAIAVIAVVLYHSELPWIGGGFLGVEAFFVISGYLITSLLLEERRATGSISYRRFLARRARRLLPALAFFLVGSLALAAAFARETLETLISEIPAAAFYVYNWFAIAGEQSYFQGFERPSLFQHLWSLAIEEQFYLFWPLVLLVAVRWIPRRGLQVLTLAAAAGSALWMASLYIPLEDATRLYYGTDTRLSGILLGAALAFAWNPLRAEIGARRLGIRPWITDAVGIVGLAILGWSFFAVRGDVLGADWLYRGGFVVAAAATGMAIAATAHPDSRLGRVLSLPVLSYIGQRSYAIYLWHWPVFMITRPRVDVGLEGASLLVLRLALTVLLAELSYLLVEQPVRERRFLAGAKGFLGAPWRGRRPAYTMATVAAFALIGSALFGVQDQWRAAVAAAEAAATAPATETGADAVLALPEVVPLPVVPEPSSTTAAPEIDEPSTTQEAEAQPAEQKKNKNTKNEEAGEDAKSKKDNADDENKKSREKSSEKSGEKSNKKDADAETVEPSVTVTVFETTRTTTPPQEDVKAKKKKKKEEKPKPVAFIGIGDSVMLGAAPSLEAAGAVAVDGEVGRQWWEAADAVVAAKQGGLEADVVVIHLGHNSPFTQEMVDDVLYKLRNIDRLVLVNLRLPRRWESDANKEIAAAAKRWDNAVLVDWHSFANDHPEFFGADGIHLATAGREAYAGLVAEAVNR